MKELVTAAAAVVTDPEGRVLLILQNYGQRRWCLPGGRINHNETPVHAVVREVRHQTGLETDVVDMVGLYHLVGGGNGLPEQLTYAFRCSVVGGEASVNHPSKVAQVGWYDCAVLPAPTTLTAPLILADATGRRSGVVRDVARG